MAERILALDLGNVSSPTGWFDGQVGGILQPTKTRVEFNFYDTVLRMFQNTFKEGRPYTFVVFEDAFMQRGKAAYGFFLRKSILNLVAQSFNVETKGYHVSTIKKVFVGNGEADKKEIMAKVKSMGIDFVDNNHADAIAVWYTHQEFLKYNA